MPNGLDLTLVATPARPAPHGSTPCEDASRTATAPVRLELVDCQITPPGAVRPEPDHALTLAARAKEEAPAPGHSDHLCHTLLADADAHYFKGDQSESLARSEDAALQAQRLAAERGDIEQEVAALARLARAAQARGALEAALVYSQRRLDLARSLQEAAPEARPYALLLAQALNSAAIIRLDAGDYLAAEPFLVSGLRWARESADAKTETIILSNMAILQSASGQHAEAAATFAEVAWQHKRSGNQAARIKALGNFAECALAQGDISEAETACIEALETVEVQGIRQAEPTLRRLQGRVLCLQGRYEEAEAVLSAGLARASSAGERQSLPLLRAEQGRVAFARGCHATAIELLEEALVLAGEMNRPSDAREVYSYLAEAAEAAGDFATALRHHKEYHWLSQSLQASAADRRLAVSLASLSVEKAQVQARRASQEAQALAEANIQNEALLQQLRAQAHQLTSLVESDPLTGLYNRRFLDRRLTDLLALARRDGTPLSVAVLDLDNFKSINDRFSHETGDFVLQVASRLLSERLRPGDVLVRYGGEEFVLVLPGLSAGEAGHICERLRTAVSGYAWRDIRPDLAVTASIGIADRTDADTPEQLVSIADERLYGAKAAGKDRVVTFR